jgi:hypothetical protein
MKVHGNLSTLEEITKGTVVITSNLENQQINLIWQIRANKSKLDIIRWGGFS